MRVVIIAVDNKILIDGEWREVDCTALKADRIQVIQWNNNTGWIEYINDPYSPPSSWMPPLTIDSIEPYQSYINAWEIAGPVISPPVLPNYPSSN